MPYKTKGKCVYKKDTDKKVGCTDGPVEDYLAALHANANEGISRERLREIVKEELLAIREAWVASPGGGADLCDYKNTGPG